MCTPIRLLFCVTGAIFIALLSFPSMAESLEPVATFSIVARDASSGDLGVAVQSKFFAVGSVVPYAQAGVGAVATQSFANVRYGPEGLALLESGMSAKETMRTLTDADEKRDRRQAGIVDANGGSASFTGEKCMDWAGHISKPGFCVQGNILAGKAVVEAMAEAYVTAWENAEGELADWLVAALRAGQAAGGDKRGRQSAALLVVREKGGYGGGNDRYVDIRVDDHAEPIEELARLLEMHKEFYKRGKKQTPNFEMLWETQIDPRWEPGDAEENGITSEFVEFSPDGSMLVTGNGQGEAFIFKAADGELIRKIVVYAPEEIDTVSEDIKISGGKAKAMEVECGYFSKDGKYVALAGNRNEVKIYRIRNGKLVKLLDADGAEVDGMAASPNGEHFAHAGRYSAIVQSISDWSQVHRVPHGNTGAVNSIDFTGDGKYMISAGGYGRVMITRTSDWKEIGTCLIDPTSSIKSTRFSPDGKYIAAGYGGAECVAVFNAEDASLVVKIPMGFYIEAVAWTPDGQYLTAGGRDRRGNLHIFRTSDWKKVGEVEVQKDKANVEYIDTFKDLIAVAGEDAHVRVFRITPATSK